MEADSEPAAAAVLPHPSVTEQEASMTQALEEGVTAERVRAMLAPLGLTLAKLEPFVSPFVAEDIVGECTFEPGIVHGLVPQRRFANNAIFTVAATSDGAGDVELILRISNTHAWRRGRMTSNEVAAMRWAAAHGVPLIPKT